MTQENIEKLKKKLDTVAEKAEELKNYVQEIKEKLGKEELEISEVMFNIEAINSSIKGALYKRAHWDTEGFQNLWKKMRE